MFDVSDHFSECVERHAYHTYDDFIKSHGGLLDTFPNRKQNCIFVVILLQLLVSLLLLCRGVEEAASSRGRCAVLFARRSLHVRSVAFMLSMFFHSIDRELEVGLLGSVLTFAATVTCAQMNFKLTLFLNHDVRKLVRTSSTALWS